MSQPLQALERANVVRLDAAALCREIRKRPAAQGLRRVADLLINPTPGVASMQVGKLIGSVYRMGPVTVERFLAGLTVQRGIALRRVRELNYSQRSFLANALREKAGQ